MIGKLVSHYRILEEIPGGGMGKVYRAQDVILGRLVAVKFPSDEICLDRAALERFRREAKTASSFSHRNICTIYEFVESADPPFLVMELLKGKTLQKLIGGQKVDALRTVTIGIQIAEALAAAHGTGILHRDIKPGNIFIEDNDVVKIIDFGLAKFSPRTSVDSEAASSLHTAEPVTESRTIMGTANYMSPEQWDGKPLDIRTDLFSTGAVLYEMCTGHIAFSGPNVGDAILHIDPIPPVRWNKDLPARMIEILNKALEKDRDLRYQSASEIVTDLKRVERDILRIVPEAASRPRTAAPLPEILPVAILPLENATKDAETEFLAYGISDSLISTLSQLPNLRVTCRMSAFRYRPPDIDPVAVGRALNVKALLVGRIAPRGDSLSVDLELIDTVHTSHMWGRSFQRKLADLVTLQEEIADSVADEVQAKLKSGQRKRLQPRSTRNSRALQLYLKGRYHWNKRTTEALRKGLDSFKQAIELDPTYAQAYSGVSDSYAMLVWNIAMSSHDGLPLAKEFALKALEMDNRLGEAHASMAFVRLFYDWDWKGADAEFQRTFRLDASYAMARQWHAMELAALGRYEDAKRTTDRALQLDPLSNSINATSGLVFYFSRQYDQCVSQCRKTIELDPSFFASHFVCGLGLEQLGKHEESLAEFQAAVDLSGRLPLFLSALGHSYAVSGKGKEAQQIIDEIQDTSKQRYSSRYAVAAIYAGLGETSQALDWLERACDERATWMIFLRVHPYFDGLKLEPRFKGILDRLHFEL
jgi:serine/threonine protein kinase/Flp pilus assembly protein TadD